MTGTRRSPARIAGFVKDGFARARDAAAEAVGNLVVAQHGGQALDVALVGRGEHDAHFSGHQVFELVSEGGDGAVETQRGARWKFDFAERRVFFEDVDHAELIEVEAHVGFEGGLQNFRAEVDVLRADERADAGALVALLDLVPPAIDLVADHGRFFDEEGKARDER